MKKYITSIAVILVMVFWLAFVVSLTGCGGGETPPEGNQAPTVSIEINGSMLEGELVNFKAVASDADGQVVNYQWSGNVSANTAVTTETFSAGTYTATVTVTDDDGATASASKSFFVTAMTPERTYLEEFFNLDSLSVGDNWYWNGSAWELTEDACEYGVSLDQNGREELDITSLTTTSEKTLHFSLINTEVDGDLILGCSEDTYDVTDNFNDMMVIQERDENLTIIGMSDHSNPNNIGWVHTNEVLLESKLIFQ